MNTLNSVINKVVSATAPLDNAGKKRRHSEVYRCERNHSSLKYSPHCLPVTLVTREGDTQGTNRGRTRISDWEWETCGCSILESV